MAAPQLDKIDLHLKNINLLINVYVDMQTDRHPFNGLFSRTTWLTQHQEG